MENNETKERVLNFKENKTQQLTIDELRETLNENKDWEEPMNGIHHVDFIDRLCDIAQKQNMDFEIKPVYASNTGIKKFPGVSIVKALQEKYGEGSLKSHIIRRLIGRILISNLEDDKSNTVVAFGYHQDGLEIAMGPNIKICSNMSIMGREMYISTFGANKMNDYRNMLDALANWLSDFEEKRKRDLRILKGMEEITMNHEEVQQVIGDLSMIRIAKDSSESSIRSRTPYPLNQSQINQLAEKYMVDRAKNETTHISLYDFYNLGTNLHKPATMEITNIVSQNVALGDYLIKKYNLN